MAAVVLLVDTPCYSTKGTLQTSNIAAAKTCTPQVSNILVPIHGRRLSADFLCYTTVPQYGASYTAWHANPSRLRYKQKHLDSTPAGLANGRAQADKALVAGGAPDGVTGVSAHADHGVVGRGSCRWATAGASCGPVQRVRVPHHSISCTSRYA